MRIIALPHSHAAPPPQHQDEPIFKEKMRRCKWVKESNPLYLKYHDKEWGRLHEDNRNLFELLVLECFQAGLSWECVLNKRENFRRAFLDFCPEKVAAFTEEDIARLTQDKGIIRSRAKIEAAVGNARVFLSIVKEWGQFFSYLMHFTGGKIVCEPYTLRTTSPLSDVISTDLKKRGMKFTGSTVIYSYLQASGVINGHGEECDLRPEEGEKV